MNREPIFGIPNVVASCPLWVRHRQLTILCSQRRCFVGWLSLAHAGKPVITDVIPKIDSRVHLPSRHRNKNLTKKIYMKYTEG